MRVDNPIAGRNPSPRRATGRALQLLATIVAILTPCWASAQSPGPQDKESEQGPIAEQHWRIPAPGGSVLMDTLVMRSRTVRGRQPLVVINHGSPVDGNREGVTSRFDVLASWFVARGYIAVLPLRRGYGATGGYFAEGDGRCDAPDFFGAGLQGAADIQATIDYMRRQAFIAPDRSVVVGHSTGGWASLALASLNPPGIQAIVNFAGGRGAHAVGSGIQLCSTPELVRAAGRYGSTARIPTLWIYAGNDKIFGPALAKQMAETYARQGGSVDLQLVPPFRGNGHDLATNLNGQSVWEPILARFFPQR